VARIGQCAFEWTFAQVTFASAESYELTRTGKHDGEYGQQRDGSPEAATLCHVPTVGQDLPGGGRASNADKLPAAVRDTLELQIGRIGLDGLSRDLDRWLVAPVGVPEDHPQRDPAPGRDE
jgi:hypothetical protein